MANVGVFAAFRGSPMSHSVPTLILAFEDEARCRQRLEREGIAPCHAMEIASYLAQSTDIAHDLADIGAACTARGIAFRPVELDALPDELERHRPGDALVWTLTDGIAYYRGSAAPALARLGGHRVFGADDALYALCQDKFRSGAVLRALNLPVPEAGLARDGVWLVPPPAADSYFVKPNRLGSKVGIWPESHCRHAVEALDLSRRIFEAYRDDTIVQAYVAGRNARASFLAVDPACGVEALGIAAVETGADFQTMRDSLALYGETGAVARASGRGTEPRLVPIGEEHPAVADVRRLAATMMTCLGLRDVFSLDLRFEDDNTLHLIEFEVAPGLPCFDFRAYCRDHLAMELAEAMAEAAVRRLRP